MGKRKKVGNVCRGCVKELKDSEWRLDFTAKSQILGEAPLRIILCQRCTRLVALAISSELQEGHLTPEALGLKRRPIVTAPYGTLLNADGKPIRRQ